MNLVQFFKEKFSSIFSGWLQSGFWEFVKPAVLKFIFGLTNSNTEENAVAKILSNESLLEPLKNHLLIVESVRHVYEDIKNARERDLIIRHLYGSNRRADIFAYLIFFSIIGFIICLSLVKNTMIISICSTLIGIFASLFHKVCSFEFGSSLKNTKITTAKNENL